MTGAAQQKENITMSFICTK